MSTLTVELPDDLAARLAEASERRQKQPAEIIREALESTLPREPAKENPWKNRELLPAFRALEESGALLPKPGDRDSTDYISEDRDRGQDW